MPASIPRLPGWRAAVIYKQLDDFRAGKRQSGVMNAIAEGVVAVGFGRCGGLFREPCRRV